MTFAEHIAEVLSTEVDAAVDAYMAHPEDPSTVAELTVLIPLARDAAMAVAS